MEFKPFKAFKQFKWFKAARKREFFFSKERLNGIEKNPPLKKGGNEGDLQFEFSRCHRVDFLNELRKHNTSLGDKHQTTEILPQSGICCWRKFKDDVWADKSRGGSQTRALHVIVD